MTERISRPLVTSTFCSADRGAIGKLIDDMTREPRDDVAAGFRAGVEACAAAIEGHAAKQQSPRGKQIVRHLASELRAKVVYPGGPS